jgi:hypothetical protein
LGHYDNHTLPSSGDGNSHFLVRENTCEPFGESIAGFFKWTWRLLNFVRNLVMNMFFILLVLVCAASGCSSATAKQNIPAGGAVMDITGVVVDKPSASNRLGVIGRQLFGAAPTACRKTPVRYRRYHSSGKETAISPGSCWI